MGRDSASATQLPPLARTGSESSRRSCSVSHVCSSIASSCSIGPAVEAATLQLRAPSRAMLTRSCGRPLRGAALEGEHDLADGRRCPRATTFASPRRQPGGATHPGSAMRRDVATPQHVGATSASNPSHQRVQLLSGDTSGRAIPTWARAVAEAISSRYSSRAAVAETMRSSGTRTSANRRPAISAGPAGVAFVHRSPRSAHPQPATRFVRQRFRAFWTPFLLRTWSRVWMGGESREE
jgi:hypothetical protein